MVSIPRQLKDGVTYVDEVGTRIKKDGNTVYVNGQAYPYNRYKSMIMVKLVGKLREVS